MTLGHFKIIPKFTSLIAIGVLVFLSVFVAFYYNLNQNKTPNKQVLGVAENKSSSSSESSKQNSNSLPSSSSTASFQSNSSSSEVSSSSKLSTASIAISSATSTSKSSVSSTISEPINELILEGVRCNGQDVENSQIDYFCRLYDRGQGVGLVHFNFYAGSSAPSKKFFIQKGKKIDNKQYIYETYDGSICICGVHVHEYNFDTKSVKYADILSFNPLNEQGVDGADPASLIHWQAIDTCKDIKLQNSWLYSCFHALDKDPTSSNQNDYPIKRMELNETEKAKIDLVKASYFTYQTGLEKYEVPNFVTQFCAQGWSVGG